MSEVFDQWTADKIGTVIDRCEEAYTWTQLDEAQLFPDAQTAITGDVVRTTTQSKADSYSLRDRYYLAQTNQLALALGVRNYRDITQATAGYLIEGGVYINSIPGPTGASFNILGTYSPSTTYTRYDFVEYQGSSYVYINDTEISGIAPGNTDYWQLVAQAASEDVTSIVRQHIAGEDISALKIVRYDPTTGKVILADNTNADSARDVIGMSLTAALTDDPIDILQFGEHTDAGWSWANTQGIFLGSDGTILDLPPGSGDLLYLGEVLSPTRILLKLESVIQIS